MTEPWEFANASVPVPSPPVFENIGPEAIAYMDEQERKAIAELEQEAKERMSAAAEDPRQQSFFMRTDTGTVVKDEKEYNRCQAKQIPLKMIPYGHALQLLKEEDARKKHQLKAKRNKKNAKKARKANR
jgi:hypothetical protein